MMTLTEWNNYMFRRNNNNFAVHHPAVRADYNNFRMMLQQPYNHQMMNNLYGLGYWPFANYWIL